MNFRLYDVPCKQRSVTQFHFLGTDNWISAAEKIASNLKNIARRQNWVAIPKEMKHRTDIARHTSICAYTARMTNGNVQSLSFQKRISANCLKKIKETVQAGHTIRGIKLNQMIKQFNYLKNPKKRRLFRPATPSEEEIGEDVCCRCDQTVYRAELRSFITLFDCVHPF